MVLLIVVCFFMGVMVIYNRYFVQMKAGGWGEEAYFVSFAGSPNRVGPACVYILILISLKKKKVAKKHIL